MTDEHCRWLLRKCREAGLEVVVWHAASKLRLPCFVCTLFDRHGNTCYLHRASGSGCHLYRRIALSRAITEALQSRLTHIVGGRDDLSGRRTATACASTTQRDAWARRWSASPKI